MPMEVKGHLELVLKIFEFLPGSGFPSHRDLT